MELERLSRDVEQDGEIAGKRIRVYFCTCHGIRLNHHYIKGCQEYIGWYEEYE